MKNGQKVYFLIEFPTTTVDVTFAVMPEGEKIGGGALLIGGHNLPSHGSNRVN